LARGDLAIEVPRAEVPLMQKRIIYKCNQLGKPVITATQMLDSMREQAVPTRAEVNDVANAIIDGSDAVMLSDETTIGKYPVEAIKIMAQIADTIEASETGEIWSKPVDFNIESGAEAVTAAIAREACAVDAAAIVALTESGFTSRMVARHRPRKPILVLTPHEKTYYQSLLVHGCFPVLISPVHNVMEALAVSRKTLMEYGVGKVGDTFVLGAGMHFGIQGSTNLLVIEKI
jgi:pyruvate kinase